MGLAFIALGLIFIWGAETSCSWAESNIVRVAVITDATQIELTIRSPYQILALNTNEELYKGRRLWRAKVAPGESGIKIGKDDFKIYGLRIQPKKSPAIYLNGRKFRGTIDIVRQPDKRLLVVNRLDVEEYICGVLYHEVAPWWPMEALKAQAIAARSFALYQSRVNAHKDYDLESSVYSQVYGGRTSERGRTSKAVRLSKNKVLTYKNKLFPTFYHATCAGHTEKASNLWNINLPPLRGRECQFCQRSPHSRWKKKVSLQDIEEGLEKAGFKVGSIKSIEIADRNVSGRITALEIISTRGGLRVDANRFRLAVGPNIIRSTNFTVQIKNRQAYFDGQGWGHGVGMCQWGAFFMARKGFNAGQILGYYYPESKLKDFSEDYETF
ncbi:MAG: SpoIID/LytB domain-containing protein [Candidatus Omnitrophica bacterium]|nr:SpoIID/LytB domain-containing protein [Candidatus Omnitrophota bacterium]